MFGRKRNQVTTEPIKEETEMTASATADNTETMAASEEFLQFDASTSNKEIVEKAMNDALNCFFCVDSKIVRGESLAVIRLEDVYNILCKRLDVDPQSTQYAAYAEPED